MISNTELDFRKLDLRTINATLQEARDGEFTVINPAGSHAVAVGLDGPLSITVKGSTGYYCAGMNKQADIRIEGSAGPGVADARL